MQRTQATVLISLLLLGAAGTAYAKPWWMRGIESNETDFLPPDVAFRVAARVDGNALKVRWVIADGYYLYKQKIEVKAESPDLMVSAPQLPLGVVKTDPYLGTQEVYTQQVEAGKCLLTRIDAGAHPIQIKVTYQGCAEAGLCYPPITKVVFPNARTATLPAAPNIPPLPVGENRDPRGCIRISARRAGAAQGTQARRSCMKTPGLRLLGAALILLLGIWAGLKTHSVHNARQQSAHREARALRCLPGRPARRTRRTVRQPNRPVRQMNRPLRMRSFRPGCLIFR